MNVEEARRQMVTQQVRAWEVLDDAVLDTLASLPREDFVPPEFRNLAFADIRIPLPGGQKMLAPKVEGRMLQALQLDAEDKVLIVGTGSGFTTACAASMGAAVTALDIHQELTDYAQARLARFSFPRVKLETRDALTLSDDKKYTAIALTGSLPELDPRFQEALLPGGRLFAVLGEGPIMEAVLVTRGDAGFFARESLFDTWLEPLEHGSAPPRFQF